MQLKSFIFFLLILFMSKTAIAELKVCNQTNHILISAVAKKQNNQVTTKGWWLVYPGYCRTTFEEPLNGEYYVHAETDPATTKVSNAIIWGNEENFCVSNDNFEEFEKPNAMKCDHVGEIMTPFLKIDYGNTNEVSLMIQDPDKKFDDPGMAGIGYIQRMLDKLGYKGVEKATGVPGRYTFTAIKDFSEKQNICGLDFEKLYLALQSAVQNKSKIKSAKKVLKGYDSKSIRKIQRKLKKIGFNIVKTNGIADFQTLSEIHAYGQQNGFCGLDFKKLKSKLKKVG